MKAYRALLPGGWVCPDPILLVTLLVLALAACEGGVSTRTPEILRAVPHDPGAYTQGLVYHDGRLFESTGQYGRSELREVDPATGEILRRVALDSMYFGEGLARVEERLIQLTWRERTALVWDLESFELLDTFTYDTEGWGLCYDGESLWMTTGSHMLYRRDPESFELLGGVAVTRDGIPERMINELACVGRYVYANVFLTDRIVRIDKRTGRVVEVIDASGLIPEGGRPQSTDAVLNGIAHDPSTDTFYLTGKLWPTMWEARLR